MNTEDYLKNFRVLNFSVRKECMGLYLVCGCGAWNTRDDWHIKTFKDNCYMCHTPLFRLPKELEQSQALGAV